MRLYKLLAYLRRRPAHIAPDQIRAPALNQRTAGQDTFLLQYPRNQPCGRRLCRTGIPRKHHMTRRPLVRDAPRGAQLAHLMRRNEIPDNFLDLSESNHSVELIVHRLRFIIPCSAELLRILCAISRIGAQQCLFVPFVKHAVNILRRVSALLIPQSIIPSFCKRRIIRAFDQRS